MTDLEERVERLERILNTEATDGHEWTDPVPMLSRFFATPERHYRNCPECGADLSDEGEVQFTTPSDGQNIELHVIKICGECDWMRAAKFEPTQTGRPPMIQREREDE